MTDAVSDWGSGLSNGLGNDWTMLDPAIVSGQLANSLEASQENRFLTSGNNLGGHPVRPESPPNWITANLEQLTAESVPGLNNFTSQNNLIPAFNGLGLGGDRGHGGRPGAGRMGGGQWGAVPPPASTATPPPGFSHHRQMGGPLGGHYQGFPGVNKPNEAHKIGGETNILTGNSMYYCASISVRCIFVSNVALLLQNFNKPRSTGRECLPPGVESRQLMADCNAPGRRPLPRPLIGQKAKYWPLIGPPPREPESSQQCYSMII